MPSRGPGDTLRQDDDALAFVKAFMDAGKPAAAICHAPWTLLGAGTLSGRTLTSCPSIRGDLRRGGATVVDQEACVDGNLVTSRDPDTSPRSTRPPSGSSPAADPPGQRSRWNPKKPRLRIRPLTAGGTMASQDSSSVGIRLSTSRLRIGRYSGL